MLSEHTIATVKSTVPLLAENGQAITQEFYKRLFANNPDLQHIFNMANQRSGGGGQSSALADAVFAYANNIDQIEVLVPAVQRIASKHASIGIEPKHYPIVGENLIDAIQDVLQLPDNHEALIAWGEAYGVLAQIFTDTEESMYSEKEAQPGGWRGFSAPSPFRKLLRKHRKLNRFTSNQPMVALSARIPAVSILASNSLEPVTAMMRSVSTHYHRGAQRITTGFQLKPKPTGRHRNNSINVRWVIPLN